MKSHNETLPLLEPTAEDRKLFDVNSSFELSLSKGSIKKAMDTAKSADLWKCPLDDITVIDGFNVRGQGPKFDASVRAIANSMKANGFYASKPLSIFVFKDHDGNSVNGLYDGHRRYFAALLARSEGAEIEWAPCVTAPDGTSMEDLTVALVTMNEGEPLSPLEIAAVCKRLAKFGMDLDEIAIKIGKTKTYIKGLLDLMASSRTLQAMVSDGSVSATLAIATIQKHGAEASKVLAAGKEEAKGKGKTRVTAKTLKAVGVSLKAPKAAKRPARDLTVVATEWLARNPDMTGDKRIFELAALLCEVSPNEIEGRFQFKLKEVAVDSPQTCEKVAEQMALAPDVLK